MSRFPLLRIRRPRLYHPLVIGLLLAVVATASAGGWHWVKVKPGDTLTAIARAHHTSVPRLVALNHLPGNGDVIYAGSRLKVPSRHSHRHHHANPHHARHHSRARHHADRRGPAGKRWVVTTYTVRAGDSLNAICARYHVSPDRIARANHLPASLIVQIGQELRIGHWSAAARHGHHHRHHPARHRARHHRIHPHLRQRGGTLRWVSHLRSALARRSVPSRAAVGRIVATRARHFGVDPRFALAIAWQESGFNQRMVSPVGAIGAMQVMRPTGVFVSTYIVHRPLHLLKATDNVTAGVGLLSALLANTRGNERMSAAGYYQGLESVRRHGMFRDTKQYVADVLALRQRF